MLRDLPPKPVFCWELLSTESSFLPAIRDLYESALPDEERVPWDWLERSVHNRLAWRPGGWGKHLLVASPEPQRGQAEDLAGFAYAVHLPGFAGYLGYVAVAEAFRGRGVGQRLFEQTFQVLATDASAVDEDLPFVIWESRKPDDNAPSAEWDIWHARMKLFEREGGLWLEGVTLHSPNWNNPAAPPVPLQLFLTPIDEPRDRFDQPRLEEVVAGFLGRVYKSKPNDETWKRTLKASRYLRLRSPLTAQRHAERALVTS